MSLDKTTHYNWDRPNQAAVPPVNLSDELARLGVTLEQIDAVLYALSLLAGGKASSVHSHAMGDITGLSAALSGKMAADKTFKLDDLTDVDGADGAANGQVLAKTAAGWVPALPLALLGSHGHTIDQVSGLQAALDGKQSIAGRGALVGLRNKLINSDCLIWQRGLGPLSANGYQMDRCQLNSNGGTTFNTRFVNIVPGQNVVPGNARGAQRIDVTAGGGYCFWQQRIEDVRTVSGGKVTFTDYIRSPGAGYKLALVVSQAFGSGGSPSTTVVYPVGKYTFATGTDFEKVQFVFDIPSIYGKTIGTNEDSYTAIELWLCAAASSDSYLGGAANNPGQQSGIWYHSRFSLVLGDASAEADPGGVRHPQQEAALCDRYYQRLEMSLFGQGSGNIMQGYNFRCPMRAVPTAGVEANGTASGTSGNAITNLTQLGFTWNITISGGGGIYGRRGTFDAEI